MEIMKKWMTMILSICVMVLMFGGEVFADSYDTESGLYYKAYDNSVEITGYVGSAKDIVIPKTLGGKPVTRICGEVFRGNSNLESIKIPDGVEYIEAYTFFGCSSLKSIEIPSRVTSIGDQAFRNCSSLESIEIPDSVTSIENQVFQNCSKLTNIKLSNKLESIGVLAFGDCINLSSIEIPESVTSIGDQAFWECENTKFYVTKGSYAEQYLWANGMDYYYTESNPEDLNVELEITNYTGMFKAVSASVEVGEDGTFLIMALSGSGYHELFKGTYEQAVSNGNEPDNWIHGYTNDDGKWEFRIPLPNGKTYVPLVAISDSYYQKYLNGQNSLERAFYPRYVNVDVDEATLETGDYEYTAELAVNNFVEEFNLYRAALTTIGGPNSNNFKCQLELTMEDDTYNKVFVGDVDEIDKDSEVFDIVGEEFFTIPVKWVETVGRPETMKNLLAEPFVLSFYSTNDKQWHMYKFTVDEDSGKVEIEHVDDLNDFKYTVNGEGDDAEVTITKYNGVSKNVVIPDTLEGMPVTGIGESAFDGCSSLKSIVIPESVTSIGDFAFDGCNNAKFYVAQGSCAEVYLKENNIPYEYYKFNLTVTNNDENVKLTKAVLNSIGNPESEDYKRTLELTMDDDTFDRAFVGYADEIDDNSDILTIGEENVFTLPVSNVVSFYCEKTDKWHICRFTVNEEESTLVIEPADFEYTVYDDHVEITKYIGTDTNVVIPDTIEGKPVTSIGVYAFRYCDKLTSVKIPNSVTKIDFGAFYGCESLNSVVIPDSVTSIGESAFYSCESLECIKIPDSVQSIGRNVFSYCKSLKSIIVDTNNNYYDSRNNCNAIIEKESGKLIAGCNNTVIPDGVTSIGEYAFFGCEFSDILIPNSVKKIEKYAFSYCTDLKGIEIPSGVTSIGMCAFFKCNSMENIKFHDGLTSIDYWAFYDCISLRSVEIPESVTYIDEAFDGCDNAKFYVVEGSYAEEYLKENNIPYEYTKEEDPTEKDSETPTEAPSEKKSETPTVSPDNNKTKAPAKVNLKSAKNLKGKKLKAIWKKVTGAKGYEIQYSTNKKFKKAKTKTTKKTTFVIKKLKKKKTYYVRVRAYTIDASGKKVPGKWSKVKKAKISK